MRIIRFIAVAASLAALSPVAHADGARTAACAAKPAADGTTPARLSQDDIRAMLIGRDFTDIRSLGHEDGCVEAKGFDRWGKRFEVYVHPLTGDIVARK